MWGEKAQKKSINPSCGQEGSVLAPNPPTGKIPLLAEYDFLSQKIVSFTI
jgi:hypothetical protein